MILKRYGSTLHSVEADFDAKALTEVGFRRDRHTAIPADEFEDGFEHVRDHDLSAEGEGHVQHFVEQGVLDDLLAQLTHLRNGLAEGEILLVRNQDGSGQARTRQTTKNVVVDDENRLHFHYRIDPPLAVAVYRRRTPEAEGDATS